MLVADTHGALAGFVSADAATGAVAAIYIAPEHMRAGVGARLLAARGYEPDGTTDTWEGQPTLRLSMAL
jgi:GNAT superfamily N-acetyltransferase